MTPSLLFRLRQQAPSDRIPRATDSDDIEVGDKSSQLAEEENWVKPDCCLIESAQTLPLWT
ncbi:hypothetical protein Tdes44962_MAKER04045 [Teratosphaeria destructans]|uniref:Uncharacterized protein n=1 Tax=Teratosphaeria destructans TaxID=418781 RepID=A0A9W7SN98_9PEZI|nr:hypothetical protein Tdes44962_MAKER04045 [Teratosphaeria destructans]